MLAEFLVLCLEVTGSLAHRPEISDPKISDLTTWMVESPKVRSRGPNVKGRTSKDERQRTKDEGQRSKDERQRTKDEGQRTKDEGQRTRCLVTGTVRFNSLSLPCVTSDRVASLPRDSPARR